MNKKTKNSIILTSLGSIAIAGSIIAGATYALFTSESTTNIAVTSGKVNVVATIDSDSLVVYSPTLISTDDGNPTVNADNAADNDTHTFKNGGTAVLSSDGNLALNNMTPGDKATFTIKVTNESTVTVKYRTVISCDEADKELFDSLIVTFNDEHFSGSATSHYKTLNPTSDSDTLVEEINVSVELPNTANNDWQNKSCKIISTVEAVQGNAYVYDVEVSNEDDLLDALNSSEVATSIKLTDSVNLSSAYTVKTNELNIYGELDSEDNPTTSLTADSSRVFNLYGDDNPKINNGSLTISGVNLVTTKTEADATGAVNSRAINLYGLSDFDINISSSTISTKYYALNVGSKCSNLNFTVNNTKIDAWYVLNTYSEGVNAHFNNCTLTGYNFTSDGTDSNAGSVIHLDANNANLTFNKCTLIAKTAGSSMKFMSNVYVGQDSDGKDVYNGYDFINANFDKCEFKTQKVTSKTGTDGSSQEVISEAEDIPIDKLIIGGEYWNLYKTENLVVKVNGQSLFNW